MQPMQIETPKAFRRMAQLANKQELMIHASDLEGVDFSSAKSFPYVVQFKLKNGWAIYQYYVDQDGCFPLTAEAALLHTVGPTGLPFFLDWTHEAMSWFVAVDMREQPLMMSKGTVEKFAMDTLETLKGQPMPPKDAQNRFKHMMRLKRAEHRQHMSQYPIGAGEPR